MVGAFLWSRSCLAWMAGTSPAKTAAESRRIGLSSARAEAPGASRRRERRGGSGRSGPFRPQREELCVVSERPETRLRLLVDVPRRIRTRESWVFTFRTRSLPKAWDHGTALALPMDGRETPARRRAACPETGVAVPDGAGPRPRSTTRGTRPFVSGSEGDIGIFSGCVKGGRGGGDSASGPERTRRICQGILGSRRVGSAH
jgi:hypothetical protein